MSCRGGWSEASENEEKKKLVVSEGRKGSRLVSHTRDSDIRDYNTTKQDGPIMVVTGDSTANATTTTIHYASGAKYEGQVNDKSQRHGFGVLKQSCYTYEGSFVANTKEGWGRLRWDNGDTYVGTFWSNRMHGNGTFVWGSSATGESYQGEFHNGKIHGRGKKYTADGDVVEGTWSDGLCQGWTTKRFACGDTHEGYYANDKVHTHKDTHKKGLVELSWGLLSDFCIACTLLVVV